MENFLNILNILSLIFASLISVIALYNTNKIQTQEHQVSIMAQKRSERIDLMRKYSSRIISSCKTLACIDVRDKTEIQKDLISAVNSFTSLLQYIYPHDIELIDLAKELENIFICDNIDSKELALQKTDIFWKKTDLYIGTEYERLKIEASGKFNDSGEVEGEENTFSAIYAKLEDEAKKRASHNN